MTTIGALIRELRTGLGLSQEVFGRLAGRSKGAVSQWENDITAPDRAAVDALEAHGIPMRALLSAPHHQACTQEHPGRYALAPGPAIKGDVWVISWVQAGNFSEAIGPERGNPVPRTVHEQVLERHHGVEQVALARGDVV